MELKQILEKQRAFFSGHKTKDIKFRIDAIKRLRRAIYKYEDKICEALWQDLHRSKAQAYITEIGLCLQETRLFISNLKKWAKPRRAAASLAFPGSKCRVTPEPFGTALIISPWNYPILLSLLPLIAAVSAGNTVILKPSRNSAACLKVLDEMLSECFPPEHVKVFVMGRDADYELLHEKYDFIFFTGGPDTGKKVLEAAAKHVTPAAMELGGKCPCIVHGDADLKKTAARVAMGKFINAGQTCVSPDYILVQKEIKDRFVGGLKQNISVMYGSEPRACPDFGRIINEREFDRVSSYLTGAGVIMGGKTDRNERYMEPTIVDGLPENSAAMHEEIFGPLLPVFVYDRIDDAINFVNKGEKPLVLYVFTRDKKISARVLNETSSGGACVNDTVVQMASPELPFGGVGLSGFGRYRGKFGFDTFSNLKSVTVQTNLFDINLRYPPIGKTALKLFKMLLK